MAEHGQRSDMYSWAGPALFFTTLGAVLVFSGGSWVEDAAFYLNRKGHELKTYLLPFAAASSDSAPCSLRSTLPS